MNPWGVEQGAPGRFEHAMFRLEQEAVARVTRRLQQVLQENLVLVVAFGSRVRGDFRGDSDLDLLIVVRERSGVVMDRIHEILEEEEDRTGLPFSPVIKTEAAFQQERQFHTPFYWNLQREGQVLYGTL